jgi:hypothetical protein
MARPSLPPLLPPSPLFWLIPIWDIPFYKLLVLFLVSQEKENRKKGKKERKETMGKEEGEARRREGEGKR